MNKILNGLLECCGLAATLKKLINQKTILKFAKSMIKRERLVKAEDFFSFCISNNDSVVTPLEQLCEQYKNHTGVSLSSQGMNKRFNKDSVEFLKNIFQHLLNEMKIPTMSIPTTLCDKIKRIRILDATLFQLDESYAEHYRGFGGVSSEAGVKIQCEYDVLSGSYLNICIQNAVDNDNLYGQSICHTIEKGDLSIRDLAYSYMADFKRMNERGAFFVSRLKAQQVVYEKVDNFYKKIDVESFRDILQPGEYREFSELYIGQGKLKARTIIYRLTANELENRKKQQAGGKKKNGAKKKKKSPPSEINVLITNLDENQVSGEYLYQLYALRWQIELMFKTWKSIFKIHEVKKMKIERFECHLYGQLIKILMCSSIFFQMKVTMYKKEQKELSEYKGLRLVRESCQKICQALFDAGERLSLILEQIYNSLQRYGQKAQRQEKKKPFDFLFSTKENQNELE